MKSREYEGFMRKIFSLLSKEGSLQILEACKNGLESSRETPNKLGLTKRQYYTRLRKLKRLDLIQKKGEEY